MVVTMNIQPNSVAYCFASIRDFDKFITINGDKIKYKESMVEIRYGNDDICFIFDSPVNGRYDWDVHTIEYTKKYIDVEIVIYNIQPSE